MGDVKINSTVGFFSRYPQLVTTLLNVHKMIKDYKYDFPLVICGGTGNGKSMLMLHIVELWYRVVKGEKFTPDHIRFVTNTRSDWIKNFKEIDALDINANDEGADGLLSKEAMSKFGRDIQKLYNVFRKRLFFTIILIPDYFDLPLYFRKRVRGVIEVHRRGCFRYYTMDDLRYVNGYNENRPIKLMTRAYPSFRGAFPDYQGMMRPRYDEMAFQSTDEILTDLIVENDTRLTSTDYHIDKVAGLISEGKQQKDIAKELRISLRTVSMCVKKLRYLNKL